MDGRDAVKVAAAGNAEMLSDRTLLNTFTEVCRCLGASSVFARWRPRTALLPAILVCCFPSAALAGDVQSWNAADAEVLHAGRLGWSVSGAVRIKDSLGNLYDRRAGTVVGVDLGHNVRVSGGYLIRNKEYGENHFRWQQRFTTGLGYDLFHRRGVRVEGLTLYERHFTPKGYADFNRYRQRFEVEFGKKGLSPWLYQDFTFLNQGFVRSRSRAGLVWRTGSGYSFSVAYQFETIRNPSGSAWYPRHSIVTSFTGLRFHILD